jgi:hypothetical protein
VARRPPAQDQKPEEFPQTTPRDLHPTSDIRFVMVEIAKLTTKVDRLIEDVDGQDKKIELLMHQSTFIKGGIAVAVIAMGGFGWFIIQLVGGQLNSVLEALELLKK